MCPQYMIRGLNSLSLKISRQIGHSNGEAILSMYQKVRQKVDKSIIFIIPNISFNILNLLNVIDYSAAFHLKTNAFSGHYSYFCLRISVVILN